MGSERNIAVVARLKELTASQATFESKIGEMLVFFNTEVMPRWGILGAVVPDQLSVRVAHLWGGGGDGWGRAGDGVAEVGWLEWGATSSSSVAICSRW